MKTKKIFKYFSILNHEKEQEYLRDMHKNGWKFIKVTGIGMYHFEESEPEDVIYQLDYNQEGIEHKDEYVQMFNDCSWEYIQEYAGYSYFRKSASLANDNEEIFCDDESRLQMMDRVFKGRMIPLLVICSSVLIPQFIINLTSFHNYILASILGIIILLYLTVFGMFSAKYNKYKNTFKK